MIPIPYFKAIYKLLIILILTACHSQPAKTIVIARDTTITKANAFSELFLDSVQLKIFIVSTNLKGTVAQQLRDFYNSRNYQFAWFTKDGIAEQTRTFLNLHNNYIQLSHDSSTGDLQLHSQMDKLIKSDTGINVVSDKLATLELQLTEHFFKFAQHAYAGRVNPEELKWYIQRKKINLLALLDSLIANKGAKTAQWEPVNRQYKLMSNELEKYAAIDKAGGWKTLIAGNQKTYKQSDNSRWIKQLKQRLNIECVNKLKDTSATFDNELERAIKKTQKQYGLKQNGVITAALIKALNVPVNSRIEQLLINLERMRWMPQEHAGNSIIANIPDFKLHVFEDSKKLFDLDIVVGTEANKTVIFNDILTFIVFSPYWNVPASIVDKEILPGINKNAHYLSDKNMEQTGRENGLPRIRQKPGGNNSLGKVKFLFPNNYEIYFHDTPAKSLFENSSRAFSHGCIRVRHPEKLAQYLLRNQPEWNVETIDKAMNQTTEKIVTLKDPIPVLITYFTAWIDKDGLLNFRNDIYGNDKKMAAHLFIKH